MLNNTSSVRINLSSLLKPLDVSLAQIDVENVDYDRFPLFRDVPHLECILQPGDLLYMPSRHWHYVRSLSPSFSVNFWWT